MNIIDLLTSEQLNKTKLIKITKDYILFNEDEKCDSIGIIEEGKVEISTYLSNGEKIIYNSLNKGEMFGANLVFSSEPFYRGNVISTVDSSIRIISKNDLKKILMENEHFLEKFLEMQSNFTKSLNFKIKMLSMNSAKDRVIYLLENSKNEEIHYKSIVSLAETLGLTREATSRAITKLKKDGTIVHLNKTLRKKK